MRGTPFYPPVNQSVAVVVVSRNFSATPRNSLLHTGELGRAEETKYLFTSNDESCYEPWQPHHMRKRKSWPKGVAVAAMAPDSPTAKYASDEWQRDKPSHDAPGRPNNPKNGDCLDMPLYA